MNSPAAWEEIQQIIFPSRWHRNGFFYPMGYWGPADKKRIFRRLLIASIHREKNLNPPDRKISIFWSFRSHLPLPKLQKELHEIDIKTKRFIRWIVNVCTKRLYLTVLQCLCSVSYSLEPQSVQHVETVGHISSLPAVKRKSLGPSFFTNVGRYV